MTELGNLAGKLGKFASSAWVSKKNSIDSFPSNINGTHILCAILLSAKGQVRRIQVSPSLMVAGTLAILRPYFDVHKLHSYHNTLEPR